MVAVFPFSAIVGQERMKRALLLNAVSPRIGGVLIRGERGTAKSTAARALAALLPEIEVVADCPFHCDPARPKALCDLCRERVTRDGTLPTSVVRTSFVDLPVSATEDRVVGTLDLERAIKQGERHFEPGILAAANRGLLYVDEVNLLDDHIVDLLLDSAAMGVNTVEREGVSFSHPAHFLLVGTMNPEEGELRPQLLDRFGLSVRIEGVLDPEKRVQIVKFRGAYDEDPKAFVERFAPEETALSEKIDTARARLRDVSVPDNVLLTDAKIAIALGVDGHRGDLTLMKAVRAYAAMEGRPEATTADIEKVAHMVFLHRMKALPFEQARSFDRELVHKIVSGEEVDAT